MKGEPIDMIYHNFLEYSAKENMKKLRKAFNKGEEVGKEVPETITYEEALEDISYFQFVMEHGYSGYGILGKDRFAKAFTKLKSEFSKSEKDIDIEDFLDRIARHFDFIFDGHLAITTKKHGVGFYKPLRTYVSDYLLVKSQGEFVIANTNQILSFKNKDIRVLPSIRNGKSYYLLGLRSYSEVETLEVYIDEQKTKAHLHRIQSDSCQRKVIQETKVFDQVAYIKSSTFVGDSQEDLDAMYETGREFSEYPHVIWDLSNNMGGNAEFAKQFIKGLCGCCSDINKTYQLQSTLINAKETGEIQDMPYILKEIREYGESRTPSSFSGHLHIIINDSVASSGELAIIMASCIKNRTVYGCNTLGIGRFGDLLIYYLPNSKATIWCPHKIYENGIEESKGYEPDYWIDNTDTLNQVLDYIGKYK